MADVADERMIPELSAARTFWEHVHRYRFAAPYVAGRRVLDVASGAGYGGAGLRRAGAAVLGVERDPEACRHARATYDLPVVRGDAQRLPFGDRRFEAVVSFETLEHLPDQEMFLDECRRVLVDAGTLIISTPDRDAYRAHTPENPHHLRELDREEFVGLLRARFGSVELWSQCPQRAPWGSWRVLAAEHAWWRRLRGAWRLSAGLCPAWRSDLDLETRRRAPDWIATHRESFWSAAVNPFQVRPAGSGRDRPLYWVAVCRRTEG